MTYENILCQIDGPYMVVTLNRPDKLNAYTGGMGAEIADAFMRADQDDDVRAIIVTGAGRAFCAGADVSGGAKSFDTSGEHGAGVFGARAKASGPSFVEAIFNCRKPSIAAINGPPSASESRWTLPMDVRIVARGAKIGFIFARRGLVPEAGSARFLPVETRRLGNRPCAGRCPAAHSTRTKPCAAVLVSEICDPAALLGRAKEIAHELTAESSPVSIALTRQMLWRFAGEPDPYGALAVDGAMSIERGGHADVREGVQSFFEKRAPAFPGKVSQDMPSQYPWWPQRDKA